VTLISSIEVLKILILVSVLFVWVVRYENVVSEFKQFQLPDWLRDFVGIVKISCIVMIFNDDMGIVLLGSAGIVFLMIAALVNHIRIKNPLHKMLPSFTLMCFGVIIFIATS
jgi:hypothetical protein